MFARICFCLSLICLLQPDSFIVSANAFPSTGLVYFSMENLAESGTLKSMPVNKPETQFDNSIKATISKEFLFADGTKGDTIQFLKGKAENELVAVADYDTTLVKTPVTIHVLENDINPEGDPLLVTLCGYPSHGIIVLNSDKTITYTPYADYQGEDFFCYRICSAVKPLLCADTQVYVHVKPPNLNDLFVYTGVSPNGDGNNDTWKIRGVENYPENTVTIFNRWGDKVREFAGYNNTTSSWDGQNEHDELLPNGTYFYILEVKNLGVLKGWIFIRGGNE